MLTQTGLVAVGAGVVRSGVGTLASPWREGKSAHADRTRATQASPPHTTLPPPLRYGVASEAMSHNTYP